MIALNAMDLSLRSVYKKGMRIYAITYKTHKYDNLYKLTHGCLLEYEHELVNVEPPAGLQNTIIKHVSCTNVFTYYRSDDNTACFDETEWLRPKNAKFH